MRAKVKILLCALFVLGLAVPQAHAQLVHFVTQQNNQVVQYGLTELMGEVRFTVNSNAPVNSTITVTYNNTTLNNIPTAPVPVIVSGSRVDLIDPAGVTLTCQGIGYANACLAGEITLTGSNTALGGQLIIGLNTPFFSGNPAVGEYLAINGARTDISGLSVGNSVTASVSSTPSNANLFDFINVTVATVNGSLEVGVTGVTNPVCVSPSNPTIVLTEGFAGAWVQYTTGPVNARARFGATVDTHIRIAVANLPSGTTLSWPTAVAANAGAPSTLVLVDSNDTDEAIYQFTTTNQGTSDTLKVSFNVTPIVTVDPATDFGQSLVWAQLWPDDSANILAFNHPLINDPPDNFINITRCVTYLLFPFVTCENIDGFTTGMAVANTSKDDAVFGAGNGAVSQAGALTAFGFPKSAKEADNSSGTIPDALTAVISPNVAAGDTCAFTCSAEGILPGFEGYVIIRADFQFAHGFAFVVGRFNTGSVFDVAHGYLGLVIPDPDIPGVARNAAGGGESLNQ